KHFRMSRQSFENLACMMATYLNSNDSGVPVQTKLLLTLWTLANVDSFRGIGDRLEINFGSIDRTFLRIRQTLKQCNVYTHRKKFCVVTLQAVYSAYGLTATLMKPYPDNGRLDETEKNFNRVSSQNRSAVERSFSLLKNKWRRLRYLDMLLLNRISDVILSACCLHNYIIQRGDVQPEDQYREDDEENDYEEEEMDNARGSPLKNFSYTFPERG
ncbi:uncharacterized protein LOC116922685, partial [Daphnia magna]|uniref:uncharacterized protein LOC116922685 n=1 Tax=Daphnia magna TaxID=35525 RepID=UPI001E1BC616